METKKRLIITSLVLSSALLLGTIGTTVAWFAGSPYLEYNNINIGISDKNIVISPDNVDWYSSLDSDTLVGVDKFKPVSSIYSTKWIEEKKTTPEFFRGFDTATTQFVNGMNQTTIATTGFFSQAIYIKADSDSYLTIDTEKTFFASDKNKNAGLVDELLPHYPDLTKEEILSCVKENYPKGFRTFVLQGGEDLYFSDDVLCGIIQEIKQLYPDVCVTLSLGERTKESYQKLYNAGAERYLLRHETANKEHYEKLHPSKMSYDNRIECLKNIKEIGYQTGCGLMVGSPYQTLEDLVEDLRFIKDFNPEMCGIGPFIPHKDTPFKDFKQGDLILTLTPQNREYV